MVVENLISYDGAPWMFTVNLLDSGATRSPMSGSTLWTAGNPPSGGHRGGPAHPRIHRRLRRQTASSEPKPVRWNPSIE